MEYDLIISGGTLIDGTGADAVKADLAVKNGKICLLYTSDAADD